MRIGVVGINHKLADLQLRELLAKGSQRRFGAGSSAHRDHSFVLLSTCNRTEIYFCSEDLSTTHTYLLNILRQEVPQEFDQKLYSYFGHDCFLHLSRVAAGLDSAIIAETEIQGQVKNAYEAAAEYTQLPKDMHFLFQKALRIGKKVRTDLPLQRGLPDIEHAILNIGWQELKNPSEAKVLFVGASDINQKILQFFIEKQMRHLAICNRSTASAEKIATNKGIATLPWSQLNEWHNFDWIIFGTKAPEYILTPRQLPKELQQDKLIIDLSVPRNVDPLLGRHPHLILFNIDQINRTLKNRKQQVIHTIAQAEHMIATSTKNLINAFHEKELQQFTAICG